MIYYLEVCRGGSWTLIGQYPDRKSAAAIARDYRSRGERVRITTED